MNNKVLVAFIGGLVVASGITYFAMRRQDAAPAAAAQPVPVAATSQPAPAPATPPAAEPATAAPAPVVATAKPTPVVKRATHSAAPVEKPAPVSEPVAPAPAPVPAPRQVEVARAPEPAPAPEVPPMPHIDPPAPKPNTVTIPSGTTLRVRLGETLSTERSHPGDTFAATLDQPLVIDGFVLAERGARVHGRVVEADRSGKVRGVALMQVELTQLATSDGQRIRINTGYYEKKAESTKKADAAKVGIGAALGAAIGAIAGGGKGAGIGAGVGGAAGAGDVLLTRGKPVELPVETLLSFRLSEPVTVTEKLR